MTRTILRGLSGANPLGFLAALGLLRVLQPKREGVRLGFLADGSCHPFVDGVDGDFAALVADDAASAAAKRGWWLQYSKVEKKGVKLVADLKAPPPDFEKFLAAAIAQWCTGASEAALYAAAFGTSVAVDGKGNTKPTAFHFTAANQQFLGTVESIRASVTPEWTAQSLFEGHASRAGSNLRWDPSSERNWALMANDPTDEGTSVDAPVEWLAFRGLPLFPSFPFGSRILTTAVSGRGDEMRLTWPLWSVPASMSAIRSALQMSWAVPARERSARGVFAVCDSAIRRTSQGFGNFGPAAVNP